MALTRTIIARFPAAPPAGAAAPAAEVGGNFFLEGFAMIFSRRLSQKEQIR